MWTCLRIDQLEVPFCAWLSFTVTSINVFHVPDFMLWKTQQGFKKINSSKKKPLITHHVAHRPYHMNVQVLPDELKKQITDKYHKAVEQFDSELQKPAGVVLDSISNYMNKASLYKDHWHDFVSNTVKLDKLRKQNITDIVPQYKEYINDKNL